MDVGVEDRLEVKVVCGEGLLEVEGGECNPFAVVRCGSEFEQTVVLNHTTSPQWDSARMVFSDITENGTDHLLVTVNHKNLSRQSDEVIGQAIVDLRTATLSPGVESDESYELERAPGMTTNAKGSVRIEVTYFISEGDDALPDSSDEDELLEREEGADPSVLLRGRRQRAPNCIVGTIVRGRGLYLDSSSSSGREVDAYASIRVGETGPKTKTKVARRTNAPTWDQPFRLPCSDGEALLVVKVKDSGSLSKHLLGTCQISVVEIAAESDKIKWFKLLGDGYAVDGVDRGALELQLSWVYDKKVARSLSAMLSSSKPQRARALGGGAKGAVDQDDDDSSGKQRRRGGKKKRADFLQSMLRKEEDDDEPVALKRTTKEQEDVDEQRENRRMMAERVEDERDRDREKAMVAGDYQIQVHVIEARDLAGEDLNGLSDPYVRCKVLGRSKKTRVVRKVSAAVFDETLYFDLKQMKPKEIEEAVLEVSCFDFDVFTAHDLVGLATFDVEAIHSRDDHELYHHWVGLVDPKRADKTGYQGFLKLSITVLGPGDVQKFHDADKEYLEAENEEEAEDALGGLGPPGGAPFGAAAEGKLVFLVLYVWEAEDLPKMESSSGFFGSGGDSAGKVDAYLKCDFNGTSCGTSVASVRGKGNLAPVYYEQLWLPVMEPTTNKKITVGLYDSNTFSKDAPVAHLFFDYDDVERNDEYGKGSAGTSTLGSLFAFGSALGTSSSQSAATRGNGPRPQWYNLYGAPLGVQGKRGKLQNRFGGDDASTYRGRVLLGMEVVLRPSSREKQVAKRAPFRDYKAIRAAGFGLGFRPATVKYHLRCLAVMGSEIPSLRSPGALSPAKMALVVSVGNHHLRFAYEANKRGVVVWNALDTLKSVELPVRIEEIPDVCVYLIRGPPRTQTVCYCRIPAARLLKEQFSGEPRWELLKADPAIAKRHGGVAFTANPGAVLLKLGFGLSEDAVDPQFAWDEDLLKKKAVDVAPYCLRVYVFQARHLPASDENGLLDPYVKVRFCGKKDKTKVHSMTTAPLFYETLQFNELLPKDPFYGPDVVVQVWDSDNLSANTPMAMLRYPLADCVELQSEASRFPQPTWRKLTDINGDPGSGELLVSAALIKKRDVGEKFNKPEDITPQMRPAWVEVTCLGVRQLKTYRLRTPREPYVRVDVPAPNDGGSYFRTKASKRPSGRNANFGERKVIAVEMPENALFAQQMDLRVYDARSLSTPLLGATTVDLAKKMSWNADEYEPPQTDLFDDVEARRREEAAAAQRAHEEPEEDGGRRRKGGRRRRRPGEDQDQDDDEESSEDELFGAFGEPRGDDDEPSRRRKRRPKVTFADEGGGHPQDQDDDDDQDDEEAFLLGDPGEEGLFEVPPQYELERHEKPPVGSSLEDTGTGAFHPMVVTDLPEVYEDVLYQREQDEMAEKLMLREEEEKEGKRGLLASLSAKFRHATDASALVGGLLPGVEEEGFKLSDLDISFPTQWAAADYLIGREWWTEDRRGQELENYLKTRPFELYEVFRGKHHPDPAKSTKRSVGFFKGIIRVLDQDPLTAGEAIPLRLLREAAYSVRLYVIRGANLAPVDGSADPYLRVKLGGDVDERRRGHATRTLKPDFYETFEFTTVLPGPSALKIQVKDHNRFYPVHELIGETKIDLEDRWFHQEWQKLGGGEDDGDAGSTSKRNKLKPIEIRSLKKEGAATTRGQVYLWLEIRPEVDARRDKPVDLVGPEKKKFQVRVICWKSVEVPREMGDYYCEFWIGDSRKQKTDIHWRCRHGKASWNWRVKIPVELPLDAPEKGRLSMQLWDQDIIKWNDVIGESEVDLYKFFLKAYHEKRSINVFSLVNEARERKKAEEEGLITEDDLLLEEEEDDDEDDGEEEDGEEEDGDFKEEARRHDDDGGAEDAEDDDDAAEDDHLAGPQSSARERDDSAAAAAADAGGGEKPKQKKKKKKKSASATLEDDEAKLAPPDPKEVEKEDAMSFVKQLKELVGLGDLDPSAKWIKLTYHDRKKGRVAYRGKIAVSIEILPEEEAEVRPAGHGRSEPNSNPYLPPTTGRMALSSFYNPFALCAALLGDRLAYQIACLCCCLVCLVALGFIGIYFSSFYTLLESLGLVDDDGATDDLFSDVRRLTV